MSVSIVFVRSVKHLQVNSWGTLGEGNFIEACFRGYPRKPNGWRIKRFSNMLKCYAYLNKLLAGGWTLDSDYESGWNMLLALDTQLGAEGSKLSSFPVSECVGEVPFKAAVSDGLYNLLEEVNHVPE